MFTNLNRNQQRKDIPRTIAAFAEFHRQIPESLLYLHMAKKDQGWDLPEITQAYGFDITKDVGKLLIALRDYAHHFAIRYHRKRRSRERNWSHERQ